MYRNANIHNSFGFRVEQIKIVKVFDNNGEWDEFGGYLGLEIKKHLIFFGPVYFSAEKLSEFIRSNVGHIRKQTPEETLCSRQAQPSAGKTEQNQ